ncbi:MAG: sulfite exporter TauE/SafE family protein [Oscillospiraceae bacterium]|nr:sulfite exporter TauE/SafE family protein [Oscillospiraceae bacterium]
MTVLFLLIILVSFIIQSLTGFGGPLIAMPLGIAVAGVSTAKPVVTLAAWLSAAIIAVKNRRDIDYKELFKMSGVMLVFMIAGLWLFKTIKMSYLQVVYGVIVILIGLKKLFLPSEKPMPKWLAAAAVCAAGIMQGLFVSGGSFLVIYAVSAIPEKKKFRATLSGVWAIVNILLLVSYAIDGSFTRPVLTTAAWSLIPILGAVVIGSLLAGRLNQKTFLKVAYLLLVVSGAILLITNI